MSDFRKLLILKVAKHTSTGEMPEKEPSEMPDPNEQNQQQNQQGANETFDSWLAAQPDEVKTKVTSLHEAHTTGLKSALASERDARSAAEKQLRDLAKKAEKGSELEAALTKQADDLSALQKQAAFQDKAHAAGVKNLKLAFLAANQAGLVSDKGDCDFGKLKTEYPELFTPVAPGNAGNGTASGKQVFSMNDEIRRKAGRQ
jgi:hypothetical protein